MKRILSILAILAAFAAVAMAADISGTWKGTAENQGGTIERTFVFKVDGTKLTGETTSEMMGKSVITDGKIDGDNISFTITANVDVPQAGAEGVIVTEGGRFGGFGFYLLKGKPVFTWNLLDLKRVKWQSPEALTPGKHTLEFDFKYDGLGFATLAFNSVSGLGRPGTGTLKVDGKVVATQTMEKTIPLMFTVDETFDIGADTGSPIDDQDYQVPFSFTGKIDKLTIAVERPQLTPADIQKLKQAEASAADAQ